MLPGSRGVLAVGIGGGGDVVGALGVAELLRSSAPGSRDAVVGGLTWERRPYDPVPGPRRLDELRDAEPLNAAVALARAETRGPEDVPFCESHMAEFLGAPTVLVDPNPGPRVVGEGLAQAAERLGCDLVLLVDVGGDVLAHGDEPGLASPLADAVLLAAAPAIRAAGVHVAGAVIGAGCDGELTPDEVLERIAEVAHARGILGSWGLTPEVADRLRGALRTVPTEASAMAVRCFEGANGTAAIRRGRRTVRLSPVGAIAFLFDPEVAMASAARLADAVVDAPSLEDANTILHRLGVRTELDRERDAARADASGAPEA